MNPESVLNTTKNSSFLAIIECFRETCVRIEPSTNFQGSEMGRWGENVSEDGFVKLSDLLPAIPGVLDFNLNDCNFSEQSEKV